MQVLTLNFLVLQYVGLWRPLHWTSGWKKMLYSAYTCLTLFTVFTVTLSQLIAIVDGLDDAEEFANCTFMSLGFVAVCGKSITILVKRKEIIECVSGLKREPCKPNSEEESVIQSGYDEIIRLASLAWATAILITVAAILASSIMQDIPNRILPYKAWLPYDSYYSLSGYLTAYTHQMLALIAGGTINIGFDTLVPGLMVQTCAQLNILKHRFHELPQAVMDEGRKVRNSSKPILSSPRLEMTLVSHCVAHHLAIFKSSNDLFAVMLFSQYVISTIILCVNVFILSKMTLFSPEFTASLIYTVTVITQIFIYCLFGCEATIESLSIAEAIYTIEWDNLSVNAQRSLVIIMVRSRRPIEFSSGHFVTLNLDYFTSLLKLSYSAFNVLQQSD